MVIENLALRPWQKARLFIKSPIFFLVLYIFTIPAFAGLFYNFCDDGFYAPYAHLEKAWTTMGESLGKSYEKVLLNAAKYRQMNQSTSGEEYPEYYVHVSSVTTKDGKEVEFYAQGNLYDPDNERKALMFGCNLSLIPMEGFVPVITGSNSMGGFYATLIRFPSNDQCPDREMTQVFNIHNSTLFAEWPRELIKPSRQFLDGFNGVSSAVIGNFWRMLYVSAVMITTLGLGDIIPISSMARALVASEAVIGIVLAGIFLNAIANKASGKR